MKDHSLQAPEWIPESKFRETLLEQRLPAAVRDRNFFWINARLYLMHDDAQLPPEDYLRRWKEIYDCCLAEDLAALRSVSYLRLDGSRRQ